MGMSRRHAYRYNLLGLYEKSIRQELKKQGRELKSVRLTALLALAAAKHLGCGPDDEVQNALVRDHLKLRCEYHRVIFTMLFLSLFVPAIGSNFWD